jgi:hypothetical protein
VLILCVIYQTGLLQCIMRLLGIGKPVKHPIPETKRDAGYKDKYVKSPFCYNRMTTHTQWKINTV